MLEPTATTTYRIPLYRGLFHFVVSYLRILINRLLKVGMRDCGNTQLAVGDRVFDLNSYYCDRPHGDPDNDYGTIITDEKSISGLSVQWDNDEVTQLIDSSMLLKKYV